MLADATESTLVAADGLLDALDLSLADLAHREYVMGILRGSAPTFAAQLERLIKEARRARGARGVPGQPVRHRPTG